MLSPLQRLAHFLLSPLVPLPPCCSGPPRTVEVVSDIPIRDVLSNRVSEILLPGKGLGDLEAQLLASQQEGESPGVRLTTEGLIVRVGIDRLDHEGRSSSRPQTRARKTAGSVRFHEHFPRFSDSACCSQCSTLLAALFTRRSLLRKTESVKTVHVENNSFRSIEVAQSLASALLASGSVETSRLRSGV